MATRTWGGTTSNYVNGHDRRGRGLSDGPAGGAGRGALRRFRPAAGQQAAHGSLHARPSPTWTWPSTVPPRKTSDGTIASYAWNFGDGTTGTGATANHTYAAAGTYTVRLTVTDDRGGTATTTAAGHGGREPGADGVLHPHPGLPRPRRSTPPASSDPEGPITSYAWNFGDGSDGVRARRHNTPTRAAGTYTVTLTVTDNGDEDRKHVQRPSRWRPNKLPTASFTHTENLRTVTRRRRRLQRPGGHRAHLRVELR